jgi:hypothetical protein
MNLIANAVGERASKARWEDFCFSVLFAASLFAIGVAAYGTASRSQNTLMEASDFAGYSTTPAR